MRRLGRGFWHAIHLFSLVVFVAITIHALSAGTDAEEPVTLVFAIGSSVLVAGLCIARVVLAPLTTQDDADRRYSCVDG